MSMGPKSKISDPELLDSLRQSIVTPPAGKGGDPPHFNMVGSHSGLYNTATVEPKRNFIAAGNNMLLTDSSKNCGIVIGADRPSHLASGYGGKGAMGANTIDLVVGRVASNKKLADGAAVPNSFSGDAARIYISQLTDIDLNFGIEPGQAGSIKGKSAIGIKADVVRVIGREGVKIVSGRSFAFKGHGPKGETNSRGGKIQPAPPIELIGGNIKSEQGFLSLLGKETRVLQGVAKGENTRECLRDLADMLDDIWSAVFNLAIMNITAYTSLAITPIPWHAAACGAAAGTISAFVLPPLYQTRVNKTLWGVNYLSPYGDEYICSRNVYAT
jgi:hypothetical protein